MQVLGIDVDDALVERWRHWFMPAEQPFLVPRDVAADLGLVDGRDRLGPEHRDTFGLYVVPDDVVLAWLDEDDAARLPREVRRAQHERHVWPSVGEQQCGWELLVRFIEDGVRDSRHREVADDVWVAASPLLPAARWLAGRFPQRSGPNCFATVMAAAGVPDAEEVWMLREPFEAWLADAARPAAAGTGADGEPGTLLVWRGPEGAVEHAAVTLGGGWALHKPSQGWMSPTKVLDVPGLKASARARGRRLHRYRLR